MERIETKHYAIITGKDALNIDSDVNRYYIQYWCLTHFMFHHEDGRHADAYKRLIIEGGSLENFERIIGPADKIDTSGIATCKERSKT